MGYTTDFSGSLRIEPSLTPAQTAYINAFSDTRRMGRDPKVIMAQEKGANGRLRKTELPEEVTKCIAFCEALGYKLKVESTNLDWKKLKPADVYGKNGEYYVGDDDRLGVIDYNLTPGQKSFMDKDGTQPGLWCQWKINENGDLEWDGGEKFYAYVEWLEYLIENFFKDWGVVLNGEIEWQGEEMPDRGKIVVTDNEVETYEVTYKKR